MAPWTSSLVQRQKAAVYLCSLRRHKQTHKQTNSTRQQIIICDKQDLRRLVKSWRKATVLPYLTEIQHFGSCFFFCSFLGMSLCGNAPVTMKTTSCLPVRPVELEGGGYSAYYLLTPDLWL